MKCKHPLCIEKCREKAKLNTDAVQCKCIEDIGIFIWEWSPAHSSPDTKITNDNKDILFHPCYSSGTAAVRGTVPFERNLHYYWEVQMTSNMYGTDVMVGVGTAKVVFSDWKFRFCSLLGIDSQSWGYSYHGLIQHNKLVRKYGSKFGLGSSIGVHLDMNRGTLEYFLNRKPLGIAFTGIKNQELYPMVSSTAAQSAVRLTCAVSEESTLQMLCLGFIAKHKNLYQSYQQIPGLKRLYERKYFWIVPNFEEDKIKRLANLEDSLMCPLYYENFLKSHKKLRTTPWFPSDFSSDVDTSDSNVSNASSDYDTQ
ncbi:SPRY domain-containing SOCS box protein 3 [Diabrotica virgifera virgifera]|uniref:SPRY domain-containing SOCS box protein 3 n=1 Tax=Diabrotica virgifera virgifera TaxID=50390 RepID=A0A6P7FTG0_DIAVI|nr:SPRY domain-containing SOCS box protein 3 [Diabrotica virgifera virgifera]